MRTTPKTARLWLISRVLRQVRWLVAAMAAVLAAPTAAETLTGQAMIDTRIALPPDLTFEAVIEDISRADAPAEVLARTVIENPGHPPIDFAIAYDPADLRPQAIYALRAKIRQSDTVLFLTDTITRVFEGEPGGTVEVRLHPVNRSSESVASPVGAHGLRLPASFTGVLPCADCEGIRHHLDLWPDQVYHMRREWLGRTDGALTRDEVGRWYADPGRGTIVLHGASEMHLFWEVQGPDRLRQTDLSGNPIESDLPYELTSDGTLSPTDLEGLFLLGMMTYLADAAMFEECLTGRLYPIAAEGDYLALERAYLDAQADPGAPLRVHVEGGLAMRPAMEGPDRAQLIVERFIKIEPGETCPTRVATASLTDTYWRIDSLAGTPVSAAENRREPHLVLMDGPEARFRATVGCNQLFGGYERDGDRFSFGPAASTMMACPPPLDAIERHLRAALSMTQRILIDGTGLHLLGEDGTVLAELEAVYLR